MVLDQQSAERLYNRLRLEKSDGDTYEVAFENESGTLKDVLSPGDRWLTPNMYLRIFGKKFMKDIGFDVDKPKSGTKIKIPKKTMAQIEQYIEDNDNDNEIDDNDNDNEIDDNVKQLASGFNKLLISEDNQDSIMLQDIINKNEIASDNSIKSIKTSLTEIGVEAPTSGGLTLRELEGLDKVLRTISSSLRSAIAKVMDKQVGLNFLAAIINESRILVLACHQFFVLVYG